MEGGSGKVTKAGKTFEAKETPETVGVLVQKTDSESGNVVKGAGFAVFKDAACTQRVLMNGDTGAEVPVFYYDEDLDGAASEKFVKQQDVYYVKEVVVPDGYRDDGKVWERLHKFELQEQRALCDRREKKIRDAIDGMDNAE